MIRKAWFVAPVIAATVLLSAGTAFAHVEIERQGEVSADGKVSTVVHMPNEESDAGAIKLELTFPATPALTVAEPGVVNGWTGSVSKDAAGQVTSVTWSGGPLTGDTETESPLIIGNVPAGTKTIEFKALQTYDNGDEVRWIEETPAGGEEPEHPAPVLTVVGKAPADGAAATSDKGSATATTPAGSSDDDGLSTGAIVAIGAGIVVVLGGLGFVLSRTRNKMKSPTDQ